MKIVFNSQNDDFFSRAQDENENAFRKLFEMFKDKVYSYSIHITRSEIIAEDITQEVFMKLWIQIASLSEINNVEAWIITITRNLCFNHLKKKAMEQKVMNLVSNKDQERNASENTDNYILYKDQLNRLARVINGLPSQQRIIFNLKRNEGLKNEEIARQLHISTHTVKSHFVKALHKIREVLQTHPAILISAWILFK